MKRLFTALFTICLILPFAFAEDAEAQWAIGASYEIREETPQNGIGVRVERDILSAIPILDFSLRGHASFFNESTTVSRDGATVERDFESFDFGVAALAGVNVALLRPYVGLGLGMDSSSLNEEGTTDPRGYDSDDLNWNAFIGSYIRLPIVSPFIEYRFSRTFDRDIDNFDSDDFSRDNISRFAIGVSLRF